MNDHPEYQYLDLLENLLKNGETKGDRTGTGTKALFGYQMRFDLQKGFPLLTTKKLHTRSIFYELLWFLRGDTNVKYLQDNGVSIWNNWADENGDLGLIYGAQWRNFGYQPAEDYIAGTEWIHNDARAGVDQISQVIDSIKNNPDSRRHVVSAWNPVDIPKMSLLPCHCLFQFFVVNNKLSCQLYQRSCDTFLGLPFNIASYALLTHMVAKVCDLDVGDFVWTGGDVHLYLNHLDQAKKQLLRDPRPFPVLKLADKKSIDDFEYEDIEIIGYDPHPSISAPISV